MKSLPNFLRKTQQGSMLLEALFGILIFSLGILALVGLQATSVRQAASAQYRSDAALLANDLLGQMWLQANTATARQAMFASGTAGAGYTTWAAKVQATLPGSLPPTVVFNLDGTATITIFWRAPQEKTSERHQYVVTTQVI